MSRPPWRDQPDARDGEVYQVSAELATAVKVALAVRRPLLLRGEPGTGKSSLASYIAKQKDLRYYEHIVTSRTQTSDLLWTFDAVRRLGDAQLQRKDGVLDDHDYVEPGALWWALAPSSAARRGREPKPAPVVGLHPVNGEPVAVHPQLATDPFSEINSSRKGPGAVLLIDEIDKADPDVPNGLLVPLGAAQFTVAETRTRVEAEPGPDGVPPKLLVVITTNEERELPQALLRRCVLVTLPTPGPNELSAIALTHMSHSIKGFEPARYKETTLALAKEVERARIGARSNGTRPPGTAEYLAAVRACWNLRIDLGSDEWTAVKQMVLLKPRPDLADRDHGHLAG